MTMGFSQDRWERIADDYGQWWAGELKRPLIHMTLTGADPGRPPAKHEMKHFTAFYGDVATPEDIVDSWDYYLSGLRFLGDAFPHIRNNFGPGVMATYIGGRGHVDPDGSTVWFGPGQEKNIEALHFMPNDDAPWFQRMAAIYRAAVERWQGGIQLGMTDLGGNLDVLSTFRPAEQLLLDLYDYSDEVKRLTWEAHEAWWHYFDAFNRILQPTNPGYTCWAPIFSEEPYYMLQCDFCYMIGPDMFDEFVKPELDASCRRLANPFYHLDGPGQLPHLDSLLQIESLKGVQWVPGAGSPGVTEWPEVYRKIRDAGKLIQTWGHMDVLDQYVDQLGSAEGIIIFAGADVSEQDKAVEFLEKYGAPV